jgi:hypothetical protein
MTLSLSRGRYMSDRVFVVMQIGAEGSPERQRADEVYKYVIEPVLAERQLSAYRADRDPSPGAITEKLLKELLGAKVVIADLTGRNPNVFYELGITHRFARPLICLADTAGELPFDAKDERIIPLGNYAETGLTMPQGETAKEHLRAALDVVLAEDYDPPSPIRGVAASQSLDALAPENPLVAEIEKVREIAEAIFEVTTPKAFVPPTMLADLHVLRGLIGRLAEQGELNPAVLDSLKTRETSPGQDEWLTTVRPLAHRAWSSASWARASEAASSTDDPWAKGTPSGDDPWAKPSSTGNDPWAAQATQSDEAPF